MPETNLNHDLEHIKWTDYRYGKADVHLSMTSGLDFTELPSKLWNFVLESISLRLTHKVKSDSTPSDSQIWTIIPNEEREWIEIDQLKGSIFSKKQDFVGLDFNKNEPIWGEWEILDRHS